MDRTALAVDLTLTIKFLAKHAPDQDVALWTSLIPKEGFKGVKFTFDINARDYDWLAVYEGLPPFIGQKKITRVERLACHPKNTLLITTEPSSIRLDGPNFMRQFGHVLTNKHSSLIRHPSQIRQTPPLRWFYGRPMGDGGHYKTLNEMVSADLPKKTKIISTVCSTKQMSHTVHARRLEFVTALREKMPELDVYGRGIHPINEKSEAMDAYRYHIAIENHQEPGHWTEKLADCFLAGCLPFYFGDPEYANAFPKNSAIPIDIYDLEAAIQIMRQAIDNNEYEKRLPAIIKAQEMVLTQYNILSAVANIATNKHTSKQGSQSMIFGRHAFRRRYPIKAVNDALFRTVKSRSPYASPRQV